MRWLVGLLVVMLLVLQYQLWFDENGVRQTWQLRKELQRQQEENARLAERNAALAAEVDDLKSGLSAIEERARSELGMIRDGETFYQVVDPKKDDPEE